MEKRVLIYDIETLCPVLTKDTTPLPGIEYATSFQDWAGLGIACLCCYLMDKDKYRVFDSYNMGEFAALLQEHDVIVGFNNYKFDDNLLLHFDIADVSKLRSASYDILRQVYVGLGLNPDGPFYDKKYKGNNLNKIAEINLNEGKVLDGHLAPVLWQQGQRAKVIDYCLDDVRLTRKLYELIVKTGKMQTVHEEIKVAPPIQNTNNAYSF